MTSQTTVVGEREARLAEQQMDDEFSITFAVSPEHGNLLRVGSNIFMLKYWTDEQIQNGYVTIQQALAAEIVARGGKIIEPGADE